ncbi:E3 ubiquitin-protein ligase NEURL3 [Perognathus longimembris pacificus]|uniref:E3 ubiquitin-protein ligase NEURL3 n=1 Tax=Perognathus longimembris pacificus TaxID=214514 RepID=UPI0020187E6D|nr:E3 ubiquitin-protein ligase NEURL3 [Perognathus longimembris pacificus]
MGAHLSSKAAAAADAPGAALRFQEDARGAQVQLDGRARTAQRGASFHDGLVFSQRPVWPGERVALRVLRQEGGWGGGLRVGFTRRDPAGPAAPGPPPFVRPDLEAQSPTWASLLPEGCVRAGSVVCFWVNRRGWLYAKVNAGRPLLLRRDVRVGAPLWAVMDADGATEAIELLDPAAPWVSGEDAGSDLKAAPREECVICFHNAASTRLLPCGHADFCSACAQRVFRDSARCPVCRWQIDEVALVGSPRPGDDA